MSKNDCSNNKCLKSTICACNSFKSTSRTTSCSVISAGTRTTSTWKGLKFKINSKCSCRQKIKTAALVSSLKEAPKPFSRLSMNWGRWTKRFATLKIWIENTLRPSRNSAKHSSMKWAGHRTSNRKFRSVKISTRPAKVSYKKPCKTSSSCCSSKSSWKANSNSNRDRFRIWPATWRWSLTKTSSFQMSSSSSYRQMRCSNKSWTSAPHSTRLKRKWTVRSSAQSTTLSRLEATQYIATLVNRTSPCAWAPLDSDLFV